MPSFPDIVTIWKEITLEHAMVLVSTFSITLVLFIIKLTQYRKFGWLDSFLLLIILASSYATFMSDLNLPWLNQYLVFALCFGLIIYDIYALFEAKEKAGLSKEKLLQHLKNDNFDYFFSTSRKDYLTDASISCLNQLGLKSHEISKMTGFSFISKYLDVIKINQKDATEERFANFKNDYLEATKQYQSYKFELEVLEKSQIATYKGYIQPLYYGNQYLGKNVYLMKNRNEILADLRNDLTEVLASLEDAKGQLHILMSLSEQVILYYDFQTKTYVATDLFCKHTDSKKKEYNFDEFVELIHPDDLDYYIGQASTVNSLATTRIKFRFRINDTYYHVIDDSIYLEKEHGLVSVIRIVESAGEVVEPYTETQTPQETGKTDKVLDELASLNPETAFQKASEILDTIGKGKKDE